MSESLPQQKKPLYEFAIYKGDEVEEVAMSGRVMSTRVVDHVTDDGIVRFAPQDGKTTQGVSLRLLLDGRGYWRVKEKSA